MNSSKVCLRFPVKCPVKCVYHVLLPDFLAGLYILLTYEPFTEKPFCSSEAVSISFERSEARRIQSRSLVIEHERTGQTAVTSFPLFWEVRLAS
jgi:hypothetical protein